MGGFGRSVHRTYSEPDSASSQGVRGSDLQSQRRRVPSSLCEGEKKNLQHKHTQSLTSLGKHS